jgi:polyhydroxyalkanoate synthase
VAPAAIPDAAVDLLLGAARPSLRAAANVGERVFRGRLADTRLSPHTVVLDEPHCQVRRHDPTEPRHALPIVFVPPLGGTARVYDIRRGASMAQFLADSGFRVYVLDYGTLGFEDRDLGLADFVDGYVARAVEVASDDNGGLPVILAGWCAGGIFAALYATSRLARKSVAGLALLASPLDLRRGHPMYPLARLPITEPALRLARQTGLPAPLVSLVFKMTSPVRQLTKPLTVLRNLDDRDFLVHFESLDEYVNAFAAYPGAAGYELVHALLDEAILDGTLLLGRRTADVRRIKAPVMVLAGTTDVLAPAAVVQSWCDVLPHTEYHLVRGGHLGVMAGRRAPESTWTLLRDFAERVDAASAASQAPRIAVVKPRARRRQTRATARRAA